MINQAIPSGDGALVFVQPREQAFDLPAPTVTSERPRILRLGSDAIALVRIDSYQVRTPSRHLAFTPQGRANDSCAHWVWQA
jgi:hypothetical protein